MTDTDLEIYDLDLMIKTINQYKDLLKEKGRSEEDEAQKMTRMTIHQNFNNWFKFYGEW